jgi:molecular chaperone DnaJ
VRITHYATLGVHRQSSYAEIKAAYMERIREHHPDRNGGSALSARRSAELGQAWAALRDARTKAQYDLELDMTGATCGLCSGRGCGAAGLTRKPRACVACGGTGRM